MWCLLLINLLFLKTIICANILIVNDMTSPSHQLWNFAYANGLLIKGHNVTMISPHLTENVNYTNFHQIHFEGVVEQLNNAANFDATEWPTTAFGKMKMFMDYMYYCCSLTYKTKGLQQLLNYPSDFKFDLIVFDVTLANGCLYPIIQKFNYPPAIGVTAFLLPTYVSHFFGNHLHPSYLPFYHFEFDSEMSFFERVQNTVFTYLDIIAKVLYDIPNIEKIQKEYFGEKVDNIEKLQRHISLILANINPVFNIPQPVPPNIITVGGLHIRPARKLPQDIQTILDSSTNGVILFSLGTNIRSDQLDENLKKQIIDAFSKLPYTFLWKYESALETPDNIIVRKWLPINDILAHRNVKLFISHGGGLSTQEAMYHGVPVLGIPMFVDQNLNILLMTKRKIAVKLALEDMTSESLSKMIHETISNQIYTENMKEISQRFKDFPQTPLENAVHWTEYAIKYNGAQFLNTKARDLSWMVANGFDVVIFLIVLIVLLFIILVTIFCALKKMYRSLVSIKMKKE